MPRLTLGLLATIALLLATNSAHARLAANRLAANRLAANRLAANRLAAEKLAAAKLTESTFTLNSAAAADLLATEQGREVLSFIVSCAVPGGITLTVTAGGEDYEFFGELGLVKSWLRRPLNAAGRGWLSACLLARTNEHDVPVPISMRGPQKALATTPEEAATWTLEEGAFYGDYLLADDGWVACRGRDQAAGETGGLVERDCAEPDPLDPTHTQCGFVYAGDCGDFAPQHACAKFSPKGFYQSCRPQPIAPHQHSKKFRQAITTFAIP